MRRQAGFTLIELVMVIVILGILSAFALPRFADLGADARQAALEGARGAVKSASAIAHADFLVSNTTPISMEGVSIDIIFGYPEAADISAAAQLDDFSVTVAAGVATITSGNCSFTYTQATSATVPSAISTVTVPAGGC